MGLPVEVNNLMMGAVGGYQISRSVRLRSSATAWFSRTAGVPTNQYIWTVSFWTKLAQGGAFIGGGTTTPNWLYTDFGAAGMQIYYPNTGASMYLVSNALFRDPSAWYHVVLAFDSTQATPSNRVKFYVNGVQLTLSATTYPAQNSTFFWNQNGLQQRIGSITGASGNYDGYLAEFHGIDGQALTPSSFGETDAATGVWNPKKYSGTYGNNGFYLNFSDNSAATATTIGKDYSGNGNNWTPNNISVTAGTTYDSMIDSPTNYADGGTGRGNYAVLNPLVSYPSTPTTSNGNLTASKTGLYCYGTMVVSSGKFYWEVKIDANGSQDLEIGITQGQTGINNTVGSYGWGTKLSRRWDNGSLTSSSIGTATVGDIVGIALDLNANTFSVYKNGTLLYQTTSIVSGQYSPAIAAGGATGADGVTVNFGQQPFTYTPPSGFKALNTYNLPAPSIANGAQYMAASLYTGNGGTAQTITNTVDSTSFQPDFVWIKSRNSASFSHRLYDSVRGVGKELYSNASNAESTVAQSLTAFASNGFTLGTDTNNNASGTTYVGWQWKGGGTGVTNTSGTITSTVSANTTAGFSVVTYTGNSTAGATVGHGLGVAPNMVIVKTRAVAGSWAVYHSSLGATNWLLLNSPQATTTSAQEWNNTAPTSTVFTVGNASSNSNQSSAMVAYCFAAVRGYSAFGSYTGNGSADGPFIYTGFRPRWIMVKSSTEAGSWTIMDTSRLGYNANNSTLYADLTSVEQGYLPADILSNGFKIRLTSTGTSFNTSGQTYVYAAFAENPFNYSRAR